MPVRCDWKPILMGAAALRLAVADETRRRDEAGGRRKTLKRAAAVDSDKASAFGHQSSPVFLPPATRGLIGAKPLTSLTAN